MTMPNEIVISCAGNEDIFGNEKAANCRGIRSTYQFCQIGGFWHKSIGYAVITLSQCDMK